MANKKFIKPSRRTLVLNKSTGTWISPEEDVALMEMAKIKRDQAKKLLDEMEDEPSSEEQVVCNKCKEHCPANEPCCP